MLKSIFRLLVLLTAFLVGWYAGKGNLVTAHAQGHQSDVKFSVPESWGPLKAVGGAHGQNLFFEDSSGTIRITSWDSKETPFGVIHRE